MKPQWLVFVADNPAEQAHMMVVCPNWERTGHRIESFWRPVKEELRADHRVWFFEQGVGISKLCEVVPPFSDDRPHPAYPDVTQSYQWPVRVIASFAGISPVRFGGIASGTPGGSTAVPCDAQGRFRQGTYCHRLPDAVALQLGETADGAHVDPRWPSLLAAVRGG